MSSSLISHSLSEKFINVTEANIRLGGVSLGYGDKRYVCCRSLINFEAEWEVSDEL